MMHPTPDAAAIGFDLYVLRNFFDAEACAQFITEMRGAPVDAATVYGLSLLNI